MLTELGVLVDESEGLYAGVLLFVEVFNVVDEFDGFDRVGRSVTEEVLIAALGEFCGAGAAAEEYFLRALGDGARGLRGGAVVASDYRKDAFLIIKALGFRLRYVRFALVVGLDYFDDVFSAKKSFAGCEGRVDLGVGLVDEVGRGQDGVNAVLSRKRLRGPVSGKRAPILISSAANAEEASRAALSTDIAAMTTRFLITTSTSLNFERGNKYLLCAIL